MTQALGKVWLWLERRSGALHPSTSQHIRGMAPKPKPQPTWYCADEGERGHIPQQDRPVGRGCHQLAAVL